jgi:hypothetical protein
MNAIKRKPEAAARATRVITDPEEVQFLCVTMLGRDARPGEQLQLRHVRDELWELVSVESSRRREVSTDNAGGQV